MRAVATGRSAPQVGVAYATYVPRLLRDRPGLVDYVEIPFERLRHDPATSQIIQTVPTILHCASLSIGGVVRASKRTLREVRHWATRTATPWVGEHLAFVTARGANGEVIDVGYTVAPPLNDSSLHRVTTAIGRYERALDKEIILENPPQYFVTPGSTMSQGEFILELCEQSQVGLLLDLSHFLITCHNTAVDPRRAIDRLPLERTREVHLSGVRREMGSAWDDHGVSAPEEAFDLLGAVLERATPAAITLEYNWSAAFSEAVILRDIDRIRRLLCTRSHHDR